MDLRRKGLTVYELLLTLLIISVAAGLAIPSVAALTARQRQHVEINALFNAVHLARKESITRRKVVSLCPSSDLERCSEQSDWSAGWLMFENRDRDSPPRIDPGEEILWRHQVADSIDLFANRKGFTLRATFLRATNGTIVVCDREHRIRPRALVISYTGRPRVARLRRNGELYSCAD